MKNKFLTKIIKRNNSEEEFDSQKIILAIQKAGESTGEFSRKIAKKLTLKVINLVHQMFNDKCPTVEEIQDIVEEVLLFSPYKKTVKAYIIYREQHAKIREITSKSNVNLVDKYLNQEDWKVNENSNMAFSLQGLNQYISSEISETYWLNKIYPSVIKDAHQNGDFYIHDLGVISVYCVGWDLRDLLVSGFTGAVGKIESSPAKHLRSVLGQIVNFFYTLQGEAAGAQAFSNFDTLLAPFIRYDNLNYVEVKQTIQEFVFNMNVPTRVGFQCMSEDTEILTLNGWASYGDLKKGDMIKTFNIQEGVIENKPIKKLFVRKYKGIMYNLKNRIQDQLISPNHRIVRKKFYGDYCLEGVEDVLKLKSSFIVPIAGGNTNKASRLSDEEIRLVAWIIGEGTSENSNQKHRHSRRITIYQSKIKNPLKYGEIIFLLKKLKLKYHERDSYLALGSSVKMIRLNAESSRKIHSLFGDKENIKFIPQKLLNMNLCQSRLFLNTYIKADGAENCKIFTTNKKILDGLQQISVNAEYGFTILTRKPTIGTKLIYVLRLIKHKDTYIQKIKKVDYCGIIWCPNTDNETVIAKRNGKVFITGNSPFTNITIDLNVPDHFKTQSVIIGGKLKKETYGEFQLEMDIFNKAFLEVMYEGDAKGRVFTFPIPTYNITKDFDWDNPNLEMLWKITAKYGVPTFSNFVNSDMKPEDVTSMCCRLRLFTKELKSRGGGLFGANALTGSIGIATINMPRIGHLAKDEKEFFERLEKNMELAKQSLEIKRKVLEKFTEDNLYPYTTFFLRNIKKRLGGYWKNHFSTLGLLGMNEACLNLFDSNIASSTGLKFSCKVLEFMRNKLVEFQKETGNIYNLEATPAEGLSYKMAKLDKKEFPKIICANDSEGGEPFYTNSTHLPVGYSDDIFEALDHQDKLQVLYTGGSIFHGFVGEKITDTSALKSLIRVICSKYKLPYFTITPTFSICMNCGYIAGEYQNCPKCKKECEVYSRVVGYLRPVNQWNKGKKEEFSKRKTYDLKIKKGG